jgi:thymidylate synthase (FAD)
MDKVDVLDYGYAILHDKMGSDLTPVNAARVSFDRKKAEISKGDEKLIKFLAEHQHTSPFRHAMLQYEVYQPLMVARQHWKYRIGSAVLEEPDADVLEAWNESSRRYITENNTYYKPDIWRSAPENRKQGSGPNMPFNVSNILEQRLHEYIQTGQRLYEDALQDGVAPEQARLFLPAYALYVRFYWTVSLAGLIHYLEQRLGDDAQHEISEFAWAFLKLAYPHFPISFQAFGLGLK